MNTQTFTQNGITFTAEICGEQIVNEYGDKMPQVCNLTFNGETYNAGDIINVSPPEGSMFEGEEQYKIERINQAKNGNIVIVGRTARGSSDVFFSRKWNRITKQKFSR